MRILTRIVVLALALLGAGAFAQTSTRTYPNLTWDFSSGSSGFLSCDVMLLDATGGSSSTQYSVYGYLSCPGLGGSYLLNGNAYFDASGRFNMQTRLGVGNSMLCTSLIGFSGTCAIYNGTGGTVGSAFISLR